jgi:hypothetical protein
LSLHIFRDFIKHLTEHGCIKSRQKSKPLSVPEKLNIINKVDGVPSVPHTKYAELLCIPVEKFTDKLHGWSDTSKTVVRFSLT